MSKKKGVVFFLTAFMFLFAFKFKVLAADNSSIYYSSSSSNPAVGEEFYVYVNASNFSNLFSSSIDIKYDPSLIKILDLGKGELFNNKNVFTASPIKDEATGKISFITTLINEPPITTKDSKLFYIKAKFLKEGKFAIKSTSANTDLSDNNYNFRVKLSSNTSPLVINNMAYYEISTKTSSNNIDEKYKNAYDSVINVMNKANSYGVKPFFDPKNGGYTDTPYVLNAVNNGLQKDILDSRDKINLLPNELLTFKQTFSSILDNYQHPIYERIVYSINRANLNPNQQDINTCRMLIADCPWYFKSSYSSALDDVQFKLFNKTRSLVDKAKISKSPEDILEARKSIEELKTNIALTEDINNFIKTLEDELSKI